MVTLHLDSVQQSHLSAANDDLVAWLNSECASQLSNFVDTKENSKLYDIRKVPDCAHTWFDLRS